MLESTCCDHWEMILHLSAPRTLPPCRENPSLDHCRDLADILTKDRQQLCALFEDSLTGLLALAGLISCCSCSVTWQSQEPQDKPGASQRSSQLLPAGLMAWVTRQRGRARGRWGWAGRHGCQGGRGGSILCLFQLPCSMELLADAGL